MQATKDLRRKRSGWSPARVLPCLAAALLAGGVIGADVQEANDGRPQAMMLFRSGDMLNGSLVRFEPESGLRWRHPDALNPVDFDEKSVSEIVFSLAPRGDSAVIETCTLRLANRDEIRGELISCSGEEVVFNTWHAGELRIPRGAVDMIVPDGLGGGAVFDGNDGLEGWTIGEVTVPNTEPGVWSYRNGAFYATKSASIARDVKLPPVARVEMDLAWKGVFHIAIALYTDSLQPISLGTKENEPDFCDFYSLQLNSYSANLLPVKKLEPLKYIGQVPVPAFHQSSKAHLEVRVDKGRGIIGLFVDGKLVKSWVDPDGLKGNGTGVRFVHQGQGAVRLSNFRVFEWDGQFEQAIPAPAADNAVDLARLRNGDRVTGGLKKIEGGQAHFQIGESPLKIPLDRVKFIDLAGTASAQQSAPVTVRGTLESGGQVTFALERWDDDGVVGVSPVLGRVIFKPTAFSRVEFLAGATDRAKQSLPKANS